MLAASALLLAGCSAVSEASDESASPDDCVSLEACYRPDQLPLFLAEAVTLVEGWAGATYDDPPRPADHVLVPRGESRDSGCGVMTDEDFAYCPADETVWVGATTLWEFYDEQGDAAAVLALAHEWGHHVQEVAGAPLDDEDQQVSIRVENQADCVAGAVQGHLVEAGLFEDDDVDDVASLLESIAEREDDPDREHGTLDERSAAWDLGSTGGIDACSGFFPDTPLA